MDKIFIQSVAAETVIHAGGGNDEITVGNLGLLNEIGASLFLFGDADTDQIIIDDIADGTGRDVTIDKNLLQHTTSFEQLSRITSALGSRTSQRPRISSSRPS